jgi:hypothetical protein
MPVRCNRSLRHLRNGLCEVMPTCTSGHSESCHVVPRSGALNSIHLASVIFRTCNMNLTLGRHHEKYSLP